MIKVSITGNEMMNETKARELVWVTDMYDWGDCDGADLEKLCVIAEDWLDDHEGDDLAIYVRPVRSGEVTGLFALRAGVPAGPDVRAGEDCERLNELLNQAWEAALVAMARRHP